MSWDPDSLLADLKTAVERFNEDKVSRLCGELVAGIERGESLAPGVARQVLSTLRKKAHFAPMERLAEALRFTGQDDTQIRRQYAQALIDEHKFPAAVYVLESLIARTANDPEEHAEARGLLGRAYKQLYVNAVNADRAAAGLFIARRHLRLAVESYLGVYRSDENRFLWHGINAVALAQRAARDGVELTVAIDAAALSRAILAGLAGRGARETLPAWDLATGAEASLALGDSNEALLWLAQYIQRKDVDAFELASTMRQLTEVWGLEIGTMPGALLLPLLQSQLLQRKGGRIALGAGEVAPTLHRTEEHASDAQMEKVLGKEGVVTLLWYKMGLDRAQVVAKVLNPVGDGFGTGFLIRGGDLVPALGDEVFFLTNAHVVSSDPDVRATYGSLDPDEATVLFENSETAGNQHFRVKKLLWTSPPEVLDASLLRLDPPVPSLQTYPLAKNLPLADGVQKVYVIGHPGGRSLSISLNDNLLLDWDDRLVHYRAPTEGGSSGSPVFNQSWQLIGLHHAGGMSMPRLNGKEGTYPANEGIWIQRLIKALGEDGVTG